MIKRRKRQTQNKLVLVIVLSLLLITISILGVSIFRKVNYNHPIVSSVHNEQVAKANKLNNYKEGMIKTANIIINVDVQLKKKKAIQINDANKVVALTFDDGPGNASTDRILKVLEKYNIKATWFCLGSRVDSNPTMLKRISDAGHEIANHSYSHPNLVNLSLEDAKAQINNTQNSIKNVTGNTPHLLRPPYGSYNPSIESASSLKIALWNVDSWDWKYKEGNATAKHVFETMKPNAVILMHDIYDTTADAVEKIVPELVKQGYTFVTYSEMSELNGK